MKIKIWIGILFFLCPFLGCADQLNLYIWARQIPNKILQQFTEETGITVNLSAYDSNEIMYAKLKSGPNPGYDIISPSTYFIPKLQRSGLLYPLDKAKIPNFKHLDPKFLSQAYDPENHYSIPIQWGATGIFLNRSLIPQRSVHTWAEIWDPQYQHQLVILDDVREVFAIGLIKCGYSPNDEDPEHLQEAYQMLKKLRHNIKLYNSNAIETLVTDEDVTVGMAWNATIAKTQIENSAIQFIYPKDGYAIWIDSLAILKDAPHKAAAHTFINFILRPDISAKLVILELFPVPNLSAQDQVPVHLRNNTTLFPDLETLSRGTILVEISAKAMATLEDYWEHLRIN